MGVEGALDHWITGDKQKVAAVLLLGPLTQPALILGRQVRFAPDIDAVTSQDQLLRLAKMEVRDLGRDSRRLDLEQL